ncbi:MAG: hypothetical protein O7G85_16785 [Planctomycetota bacterium]|nr:hypothetical protein [Planctomycetota bacterium]
MHRIQPIHILIAFLWPGLSVPTSAQLDIQVSVKFILSDGGARPTGAIDTDAEVQAQIDLANQILDSTERGYRLDLVEIIDLPGQGGFYDAEITNSNKESLESFAKLFPQVFIWRSNSINIYINNDDGSGICSFPGAGDDLILLGQAVGTTTILHEIGHYFDLCHTQGCPCGSCDSEDTGECHDTPANDGISDTLPDLQCWFQNDIAQWTYGSNYGALSVARQNLVDDVFFNVMSYHSNRSVLTDDQMDVFTDLANDIRNSVVTGQTWFVDGSANTISPTGSSQLPFQNVLDGIFVASNDDIVLIRTGTYNEFLILNQPVTIRASRGLVRIGTSN